MYVLDRRIEELETDLETLKELNDSVDSSIEEKVDETIDGIRMLIDEQIEMLISDITMEIDLSRVDSMLEGDIEDELRESFVDRVRGEF